MMDVVSMCVDCGLPCIGDACRYRNVTVYYCDECGCEDAKYRIDGLDYCESCAVNYLSELLQDLSIKDMADAVGLSYEENF